MKRTIQNPNDSTQASKNSSRSGAFSSLFAVRTSARSSKLDDACTSAVDTNAACASRVRLAAGCIALSMALVMLTMVPTVSMADTNLSNEPQVVDVTKNGDAEKQEVVYGKLNLDGETQALYVVNNFSQVDGQVVADYGDYESVVNLTDDSSVASTLGEVLFNSSKEEFSYQGNLASTNLPWEISIAYFLDGNQISPESLAGASGNLQIVFKTKKNPAVDQAYYDNYLVQASFTLPLDKATEVKTEDGSIALSGSNTQVNFMVMPGKEGDCSLTAKINNFEMGSVSVAAVPFSMGLDFPDTDSMVSGFDELIEGTRVLAQSTEVMQQGSEQLTQGGPALVQASTQISGKTQQLYQGVAAYTDGVTQFAQSASALAASDGDLKTAAAGLNAGMEVASAKATENLNNVGAWAQWYATLSPENKTLVDQMGADQLPNLTSAATTAGTLDGAINGTTAPQQTAGLKTGLTNYTAGVNSTLDGLAANAQKLDSSGGQLSGNMQTYANGISEYCGQVTRFAGGTTELAQGIEQLSAGTKELYEQTQGIPDKLRAQIDEFTADYDKSDYVPRSFTSSKNSNVKLVQFVMTTDPITIVEPEKQVEEPAEQSMLDRFLHLFGGN